MLLLIGSLGFAQPNNPDNSSHPACNTPNPPFWCHNNPGNPVPIPVWPLFGLVVIASLGYTYYKYKKENA